MTASRYREMEVLTASPLGLVVRLYEEAIRQCRAAALHHEAGRIEARGRSASKALAIVRELDAALDHEQGGEIARNLSSLYRFASDRILEGHVRERPVALGEAERVLTELHAAWSGIARGAARVG